MKQVAKGNRYLYMHSLMIRFIMLPIFVVIINLTTLYTSDAQLIGRWTAMGDMDYKPKAIIEIYEADGKIHGRVEKVLPDAAVTVCAKCDGDLRGKPLNGMTIMTDLVKTENGAKDGKILDPASGNTYSCYIELESPDKLKLRGYLGFSLLGRTQYWFRIKE